MGKSLRDIPDQREEAHAHERQLFRNCHSYSGLLYIISPIDLVPDVIPVVGWADDVAVGLGAGAVALAGGRK